MERIIKAKETMSAKQRVLKTFNLEKTDRVTIGYEANEAIGSAVMSALCAKDKEDLLQMLGVDYRLLNAQYTGKNLFQPKPDRMLSPLQGCYMRWVQHQTGGYWDYCDFPLQGVDDEALYSFPVPNPDDFDYEALGGLFHYHQDRAIAIAGAGTPDIINANGRVMGMEDVLCHLISENEAALSYIDRRIHMQLGVMERTLSKYKDKIDFIWLGEDLGTQHSPIMSLDLYRRILRPRHQLFIDLAKAYNKPTLIHTCGSSSWVYGDFIQMGVSGVDTLQPEATNMSPAYLKEHFGSRLCFRGCISTAGPLAYGTPHQTREICKETLEIMMRGYGYHFAPAHLIQDNTPCQNVLAMYRAVHEFGVYA